DPRRRAIGAAGDRVRRAPHRMRRALAHAQPEAPGARGAPADPRRADRRPRGRGRRRARGDRARARVRLRARGPAPAAGPAPRGAPRAGGV
ncbi:MAG: hypothetical protein AVDCRST_MAG30-1867, partial [uncultured Solirubrobacteraceae bacterium]